MKKLVALLMILCMVLTLAACGTGSSTGPVNQGNTAVQTEEDTYDGTPPITTKSGQSLKILARTSNYPNVDIAEAEIVKKVIENAGISVNWQLVDHGNYADSVAPMLTTAMQMQTLSRP